MYFSALLGFPVTITDLVFVFFFFFSVLLGVPEDHMYVVLNRFLLSHQSLDLRRVPEFFKLFYGFDLEVKHHVNSGTLFLFTRPARD